MTRAPEPAYYIGDIPVFSYENSWRASQPVTDEQRWYYSQMQIYYRTRRLKYAAVIIEFTSVYEEYRVMERLRTIGCDGCAPYFNLEAGSYDSIYATQTLGMDGVE